MISSVRAISQFTSVASFFKRSSACTTLSSSKMLPLTEDSSESRASSKPLSRTFCSPLCFSTSVRRFSTSGRSDLRMEPSA